MEEVYSIRAHFFLFVFLEKSLFYAKQMRFLLKIVWQTKAAIENICSHRRFMANKFKSNLEKIGTRQVNDFSRSLFYLQTQPLTEWRTLVFSEFEIKPPSPQEMSR